MYGVNGIIYMLYDVVINFMDDSVVVCEFKIKNEI